MTNLTRLGQAEILRLPGDRATVTGTLTQIDALLSQLNRAGRLAAVSTPVSDGRPGRYVVNVRLLPDRAARRARASRWSTRRIALTVAAAVVVLAGAATLVVLAVQWVMTHIALVLAVLIVLVLVTGGAVKRHCPKCPGV